MATFPPQPSNGAMAPENGNGAAINGAMDASFSSASNMPQNGEASRTLWLVISHQLQLTEHV